ncbi:MAG: flagellar protein FlgN [Planctomycetota bacterium]
MNAAQRDARLRMSVEELCEVLGRIEQLHDRLLETLVAKENALTQVRLDELAELKPVEEELIRGLIEEEKERLLVTEEVGDLLDHEAPSRIRLSEMLPHLPGDLSERLAERRESLREVALCLSRQNAVNRALIEHSIGHVHVFLSKVVHEQMGGQYDQRGASAGDGRGSLFMDRRI